VDECLLTRLLEGRLALVTGAARGIGLAIAERLESEGATVVTVDRVPERQSASKAPIDFVFDLSRTEDLASLIKQVDRSFGPLDILVNNAGVAEPVPALDLSLESYRRVLAVNVDAPVFLAIAAARAMVARGYGRIVNITSVHGSRGEELALSYDTAKGGLNQATRTLAIELGPHGVLVNAVAPGFVATDMSIVNGVNELETEWFSDVYLKYGKLPLRRHAETHEVAAQVAWLASDQNTYITGQVISVDGGLTVTF
jgi:NAD(P)-dependent dehydrogenase (short-subunit alcohol dehydrogenase family)